MRKNMIITSLAMMMAMQEQGIRYEKEDNANSKEKKQPKKVIPKGCKEYHFTKSGRFDTTENMWNDIDYIFTCVATNSKNAIKKFNNFLKENK